MNQTNTYRPPLSDILDHLSAAIKLSTAAIPEYSEGDLAIVHRKVKAARDHLSIAEQMLAHAVFLIRESV